MSEGLSATSAGVNRGKEFQGDGLVIQSLLGLEAWQGQGLRRNHCAGVQRAPGEVANEGGWQGWVLQGLVGIWILFSVQWP